MHREICVRVVLVSRFFSSLRTRAWVRVARSFCLARLMGEGPVIGFPAACLPSLLAYLRARLRRCIVALQPGWVGGRIELGVRGMNAMVLDIVSRDYQDGIRGEHDKGCKDVSARDMESRVLDAVVLSHLWLQRGP